MLFEIQQTFVGVDHLLEIGIFFANITETGLAVKSGIGFYSFIEAPGAGGVGRCQNASGKITPHGDEMDVGLESFLQSAQRLPDFFEVLMLKSFVNRNIVVPPTEMRGGRGFYAGAGGAGNGIDVYIRSEQTGGRQGQQGQLDAGGKAARIGNFVGRRILSFCNSGKP